MKTDRGSTKCGKTKPRARELRRGQTKSEGLLWSVLRANQVCGLKFRRQHPIDHFFADFACVAKSLIVEIDGLYHDRTAEEDMVRQRHLESRGWRVLRYTSEDVEADPEIVVIGITRLLGLEYRFIKRSGAGAGMKSRN